MKKIVVFLGHPRVKSYCGALAESYVHGAREAGAHVTYVKLIDLKFDAVGAHDYRGAPPLEKDLQKMQTLITNADHLVFVYPTWWGSPPALLKGFFDRVLTSGFAFKYRSDGMGWHKLLKGRSARIITATGGPWALNHFIYHAPGIRMIKWASLWFSGIWPVRVSEFNGLNTKWVSPTKKEQWIQKAKRIGARDAR